jgi:hypothetical protein
MNRGEIDRSSEMDDSSWAHFQGDSLQLDRPAKSSIGRKSRPLRVKTETSYDILVFGS